MLRFDFDDKKVEDLAEALGATPRQISMAIGRSTKRTAGTIRRLSSTGLRTELGLRNATALRRRIKEFRVSKGSNDRNSVKLWYGANDLPISAFPGRKTKVPGGVKVGDIMIHGAFVAKIGGKVSAYVRDGAGRWNIREATVPVADKMMTYLEDRVFVDVEAIMWKHFEHEIRAYTILGVND